MRSRSSASPPDLSLVEALGESARDLVLAEDVSLTVAFTSEDGSRIAIRLVDGMLTDVAFAAASLVPSCELEIWTGADEPLKGLLSLLTPGSKVRFRTATSDIQPMPPFVDSPRRPADMPTTAQCQLITRILRTPFEDDLVVSSVIADGRLVPPPPNLRLPAHRLEITMSWYSYISSQSYANDPRALFRMRDHHFGGSSANAMIYGAGVLTDAEFILANFPPGPDPLQRWARVIDSVSYRLWTHDLVHRLSD